MVDELVVVDSKTFTTNDRRPARGFWPETSSSLKALTARLKPRAVVAQYVHMAPYLNDIPATALKMIQTHDMLTRVSTEIGRHGISTDNREYTPEQERAALLSCDVVIAIQEHEASLFRELVPERKVITVGYATSAQPAPHSVERPSSVFLVGSRNPLNKDGLEWFLGRVWPQILSSCPHATLKVAGELCQHLPAQVTNCEPLGVVQDLSSAYHSAAVVINPIRFGTGLKIKTIEALSYRKAIVSTPQGIEGLPAPVESAVVVANDQDQFALAVSRLLRDEQYRRRYEDAAVSYVSHFLNFDQVYRPLYEELHRTPIWSGSEWAQ
jgi:glycosyltransferase involved in cell wall biosynthesis